MMGLSSMGYGGGGNSSTSNLSASAPPFTVDRLNPKPNSSPMLHYSDSPYVVEPFSHSPRYPHLSALRADVAIDSTEVISVSASDDYRFSASAPLSPPSTQWSAHNSGYGGDVKPYYSPYAPSLVGEASLLAKDEGSRYSVATVTPTRGLSVTSQHDYTQSLFDLEYRPHWVGGLGFDDGKRAKRSEGDGKFSSDKLYVGGSHGYENQLYRGGRGSENRNNFKEDSGVLYKNLNQISDQEVYAGSSSTAYIERTKCLEQELGFVNTSPPVMSSPYPESYPPVMSSPYPESYSPVMSSPYSESYPPVMSSAMEKNFPNYQNSSNPYEKCVRHVDTPFTGHVSVIRSSPTVVIRPPPASGWNSGQGNASRKPVGSQNAAGIHIVDSDYTNLSKSKDSGLKPNSKFKDDSSEMSPFKFSMQGNAPVSSTSAKELSRVLHPKDTSDCKVKATLGSRMPDVNGASGLPMTGDNIQGVNSTEESSEFMDHHSTVDSPCWKGAPSSQFSMFDIESGNCDHLKINLVEQYGFGHGEHQSLHSTVDSNRVFSEKVDCNMGNENERGRNGVTLGSEKTLDAICSTTEQSLLDGISDRVWIPPTTRSKGVELSGDSNMLTAKEPNLLNNLTGVFDMKVSDTKHLFGEGCIGMIVNDASEGAAVAVHAAEKVLASPASQEDVTEHTMVPDPRLDVPAIVKSMHSLSELLRLHISSDVFPLGVENTETLRHVISNVDFCLSKKAVHAGAANKPESKDPSGESLAVPGESSSVGIISRGPRKCEASNSCTNAEYLHLHKGERNYIFPGKKDEITPIVSPLGDDFHITGDDDMAKSIKKVLEQNFEIDKDTHSQALLFKNLWLEAEAKLCSISYKARFERMKAQMKDIKLKAPKEDEDFAEMTSEICTSPDTIIMSELAPKARADTFQKPILPNASTSGVSVYADSVEASILARFKILKSREEDPNPMKSEEQYHSEIVGGNHADSVIARYNVLKSREDNLPMKTDDKHQYETVDGNHADSVMARFNILKTREENSKLISMDEERPPQMSSDKFAGEKYFRPHTRDHSEGEALDGVALQPNFHYQGGSLTGGKFSSYFEPAEYESPIEYSGSVTNKPSMHLVQSGSSKTINENKPGWHDSCSSSEWEHVMKEEFSWKN